jgi:Protein of unknown function (DUF3016)
MRFAMNAFRILHSLRILLMSAAFIALSACATTPRAPLPTRVQVAWAPTEQLSEVKDNSFHRGTLKPADWMKSLGDYLVRRGDVVLPPGDQLQVTINDIKLAGDFEPWRGPNAQDIRFMTDLYPPRMDLHYKVLSADGSVLREGDSKLRDLGYLQRTVNVFETDPLRYDKRLLDDWLTKEFRRSES